MTLEALFLSALHVELSEAKSSGFPAGSPSLRGKTEKIGGEKRSNELGDLLITCFTYLNLAPISGILVPRIEDETASSHA
jgi:hypothetical protein